MPLTKRHKKGTVHFSENLFSSLALIGSAIAGQTIGVHASDNKTTYTDGLVIYLAANEKIEVLSSLFIHAALIAEGSLAPHLLKALVSNRNLSRRYFAIESIRAIKNSKQLIPLECEQLILRALKAPHSISPDNSLAIAKSDTVIDLPPKFFGQLRPWKILKTIGVTNLLGSLKSESKHEDPDILQMDEADDDDTDTSKVLEWMSSKVPMENFLTRFIRDQIFNAKHSPQAGGENGNDEISVVSAKSTSSIGEGATATKRPIDISTLELFAMPQATAYPEWDRNKHQYRANWCFVSEMDPAIKPSQHVESQYDYDLQRGLARLGLTFESHHYRDNGDSLDLRALVDYSIAKVAGGTVDDRVYCARLKTAHSLSVLVLLDASGSLAEQNQDKSDVWTAQIKLANNLINGLEQVGDRVAAFGFRSFGRKDVRFLRIKTFDDNFDSDSKDRLASIEPSGFTRLGAALRHATKYIKAEGGSARTLIVLISDGLPYEDGYEGKYATEDTCKAIEEANKQGVGCTCLALGSTVKDTDALGFQPGVNFLQLETPFDLGLQVETLFKSSIQQSIEATYANAS